MKTVQFTGTNQQIENLLHTKSKFADDRMPQQTETRVYVVDSEESEEFNTSMCDEDFMTLAEQSGRVYSLETFQEAFNFGDINTFTDYIRIINVPNYGNNTI